MKHKIWDKKFTELKLDGVGLVDNRPSTEKLYYLKRKEEEKNWHVTGGKWQVTCDMWNVTCEMWHEEGGEHSFKISCP